MDMCAGLQVEGSAHLLGQHSISSDSAEAAGDAGVPHLAQL